MNDDNYDCKWLTYSHLKSIDEEEDILPEQPNNSTELNTATENVIETPRINPETDHDSASSTSSSDEASEQQPPPKIVLSELPLKSLSHKKEYHYLNKDVDDATVFNRLKEIYLKDMKEIRSRRILMLIQQWPETKHETQVYRSPHILSQFTSRVNSKAISPIISAYTSEYASKRTSSVSTRNVSNTTTPRSAKKTSPRYPEIAHRNTSGSSHHLRVNPLEGDRIALGTNSPVGIKKINTGRSCVIRKKKNFCEQKKKSYANIYIERVPVLNCDGYETSKWTHPEYYEGNDEYYTWDSNVDTRELGTEKPIRRKKIRKLKRKKNIEINE